MAARSYYSYYPKARCHDKLGKLKFGLDPELQHNLIIINFTNLELSK